MRVKVQCQLFAVFVAACGVGAGCSSPGGGSSAQGGSAGTAQGAGGVGASAGTASAASGTTSGTSGASGASTAGGATGVSGAQASGGNAGATGSAGTGGGGAGGSSSGTRFAVVTNRYDNGRTGANTSETVLNTSNVAPGKFGLLFSRLLDGNPYGQPLYVGGLAIAGAAHNVVFVATSTNNVYAFDADDPSAMTAYWSKQVAPPANVTIGGSPGAVNPVGTTWCQDMYPFSGVTGTPVIDLTSNRMYLVSQEGKPGSAPYLLKLHALDLATGAEVGGGPVVIDATVNGTGAGSVGGKLKVDSWRNFNRAGLTLVNGALYVGLTSHCDENPYHGWLFAFDPTTLAQKSVLNTSPNAMGAAIWQSGVGIAANATGLFFSTSNGNHANDGSALGVSVAHVGFDNTVLDWFTPSNADALNSVDMDLTGGVLLIPGSNYLVSGGKEGVAYLIDETNMTHFNGTDRITQRVTVGTSDIHDFVFYNNHLYVWPDGNPLKVYPFANGKLDDSAGGVQMFDGYTPPHPGGIMTISANGTTAGTGILWATVITTGDAWHNIAKGALIALDAADPTKVLFDSTQGGGVNALGNLAKFSPPTVANGKVYVATFAAVNATSPSYLRVYGLQN